MFSLVMTMMIVMVAQFGKDDFISLKHTLIMSQLGKDIFISLKHSVLIAHFGKDNFISLKHIVPFKLRINVITF